MGASELAEEKAGASMPADANTPCADVNAAFLACKNKDANPAACLAQGEAVTACSLSIIRRMGTMCGESLDAYSACLDKNGMEFSKCRAAQAAFEECAKQQ